MELSRKLYFTLEQAVDWLGTRKAERERALDYGADAPPRGEEASHKDADRRRARNEAQKKSIETLGGDGR